MTRSLDKLASSRNDSSRSAFNKNNGSRPAFERNNDNGKIDGFSSDGMEHTKKSWKSKKFSKSGNLKDEKLFKSQKLAKSGKSLSKSGNLLNFNTKNIGPSFLIPKVRAAFNHLWLAFIEAPILRHFNPEC